MRAMRKKSHRENKLNKGYLRCDNNVVVRSFSL